MGKKKKGSTKVSVSLSEPHRRQATKVRGFWRRKTKKEYKIREHKRVKARTPAEIAKSGTRNQERVEKRRKTAKRQYQRRMKK